ncbi:MAG: sugar ABC transporter permease [Desulfovibrionaceae bacterium]|jgi:putative spermidine/putrescine transport system permease protein|nr:sugar ABC transporter permease [Desulfovibrionaceae bacterium]
MAGAARPARTLLRLAPLWVPFLLLFVGGLGLAVAQSLGFGPGLAVSAPVGPGGLSASGGSPWAAYARLAEPRFVASFLLALKVALASSLAAVALGALLAYGVWRLPVGAQRWATVYRVPLVLPHIAVAFLVLVFWAKSGLVASLAHHAGWIDQPREFPSVLFGGHGAGVILAYVYKETTFVLLLALACLKRFNPDLARTAQMLGAGHARTFLRVVLPHMAPTLHAAFLILFLYTFGAFEIPYLIGDSSPAMPAVEAYNLYFQRDLALRPQAMAILVVLFLFSLAFIALYVRATAGQPSRERKL